MQPLSQKEGKPRAHFWVQVQQAQQVLSESLVCATKCRDTKSVCVSVYTQVQCARFTLPTLKHSGKVTSSRREQTPWPTSARPWHSSQQSTTIKTSQRSLSVPVRHAVKQVAAVCGSDRRGGAEPGSCISYSHCPEALGLISLWLFAVKANVWNKRTFSFLSVAPTHPTISSVVNTYLPVTHTLTLWHTSITNTHLTLSSMIQSMVMNKRSKVTKRQKVLLTSEMHFFSPASYDSTLAHMGGVLMDPTARPISRESALLHRLSIPG